MTKKKFIFGMVGIAAIAVAAVVTVSSVNAIASQSDLLTKNLEALTRYEGEPVVITCSTSATGSSGQCWEYVQIDTWTHACRFSGRQSDHCTIS